MAYDQFPRQQYVKVFNSGIEERLGAFTVDKIMQLKYIVLTMLKNGASVGAETLQLKIYPSWNSNRPVMISSAVRQLTDTGALNAQSWIGRLRFDFDGENLDPDETYYLRIATANYSRSVSYYLGAILDWPDTVHTQSRTVAGAQIRVLGHCERSNNMAVGGEIRLVEVAEGTVITAPSDMTVPASSFCAPVEFNAFPGIEPLLEVDSTTGARVLKFSTANRGSEKAIAFVKIPQDYVTGTPISMFVAMYSPSTSNTILLSATTYLVEKDTDAMESTADSFASTNTAITNATTARKYRQVELGLTDSNGQINGQAVEAGDTLRVEIIRGTDTDTADIRFVPGLSEVQYNG